jgi:hypothetical protein
MTLEQLRSRLENVSLEQQEEVFGQTYTLRTFISDLHWGMEREVLSGTLSFESLQAVPQIDGRRTFIPSGTTVMFSLFHGAISLYLAIFANRSKSEKSAVKINYILTTGRSVPEPITFNCRIPSRAIEQFLANHPHTKKVGGWKDLDFIGVSKSSLHGPDIDQFDQTSRYDAHGRKSYIMVELLGTRIVVRISEEGIITFYGAITNEDALDWVRTEIIPLLT